MSALEFSRVTLPPLVTLEEAKWQLRITDALHDPDITAKMAIAQEAVLAFMGSAADPAWTDTTAPQAVKHAIQMLTTHYYEHRGDDMSPTASGSTPDTAVWNAIWLLLGPYRDPIVK